MRLTSEGLRELYQKETSRAARTSHVDCLTEELLTRAAAGELNAREKGMVADHLLSCFGCSQEYRSILSLKPWVDNALREVSASGSQPTGPSGVVTPFPLERRTSRSLWFYLPYAIAAALLIVSLVLGLQLLSQRRENQRLVAQVNEQVPTAVPPETQRLLEEANRRAEQEASARRVAEEELARRSASTPPPKSEGRFHVNVPIFDLDPGSAARGQQNDKVTTINVPSDADLFTLILNVAGEQSRSGYSLEILDQRGKVVWSSRGLRMSPYNNFTVALPRRSFPAGEYRLRLYGQRDNRRQLVEEYRVRISV